MPLYPKDWDGSDPSRNHQLPQEKRRVTVEIHFPFEKFFFERFDVKNPHNTFSCDNENILLNLYPRHSPGFRWCWSSNAGFFGVVSILPEGFDESKFSSKVFSKFKIFFLEWFFFLFPFWSDKFLESLTSPCLTVTHSFFACVQAQCLVLQSFVIHAVIKTLNFRCLNVIQDVLNFLVAVFSLMMVVNFLLWFSFWIHI